MAAEQGPSFSAKVLYTAGYLASGTMITISMKIAFTMTTVLGTDEKPMTFQKPWFNTYLMYLAMSLVLPFDKDTRRQFCGNSLAEGAASEAEDSAMERPHAHAQLLTGPVTPDVSSRSKKLLLAGAPASFGVLGAGLLYAGLMFIPPSVWLMLRGSEVVFAQILKVVVLRRESIAYHWVGVFFCFVGMCLVGTATILAERDQMVDVVSGSGEEEEDSSGGMDMQVLGMLLTLGGLMSNTLQITLEEYIMKECHMPELQIIGLEGAWGASILAPLLILFHFMPGADNDHFEDEISTVRMLKHNAALACVLLMFMLSVFVHETTKILLVRALTAVRVAMFGALRAGGVWVAGLVVHKLDPASLLGETWTRFSPLEVGGFVFIVLGQVVYGAVLKLPWFSYPEASDRKLVHESSDEEDTELDMPDVAQVDMSRRWL